MAGSGITFAFSAGVTAALSQCLQSLHPLDHSTQAASPSRTMASCCKRHHDLAHPLPQQADRVGDMYLEGRPEAVDAVVLCPSPLTGPLTGRPLRHGLFGVAMK